jgi:hypothetical protein
MDRRTDKLTALVIDAVLDADDPHGFVPAVSELARKGVPLHIVLQGMYETPRASPLHFQRTEKPLGSL